MFGFRWFGFRCFFFVAVCWCCSVRAFPCFPGRGSSRYLKGSRAATASATSPICRTASGARRVGWLVRHPRTSLPAGTIRVSAVGPTSGAFEFRSGRACSAVQCRPLNPQVALLVLACSFFWAGLNTAKIHAQSTVAVARESRKSSRASSRLEVALLMLPPISRVTTFQHRSPRVPPAPYSNRSLLPLPLNPP